MFYPSRSYVTGQPRLTVTTPKEGETEVVTCTADYGADRNLPVNQLPDMHMRIGDNMPLTGAKKVVTHGQNRGDRSTIVMVKE